MIQSSIFKSYDIRGIYPDQFNEATAFEIGRGFVKHAQVKNVLVGHDGRLSSPELFRALCEGIISLGANVISLGQVPTELVYFAIGNYDYDGAIMITASHNPKEYNGFKMMKKVGNDIVWIRGKDMFSTIESNGYAEVPHGKIQEKDVWQDYKKRILGFIKTEIKPFKVVVDASSGVIGKAFEIVEKSLPIEITKLNFEPDGDFPNHSPNPLEPGSSDQISAEIKKQNADFGVMFDADADRIFLVDEQGKMANPDVLRLLLAKHFLGQKPRAVVVYDLICSKTVPEFIKQWGGVPVRSKVGFVNIRENLIERKGVMGGEMSGHYCFADNYYTDSGVIAFLTLLQILSQDQRKVSKIEKEFIKYYKADQMN